MYHLLIYDNILLPYNLPLLGVIFEMKFATNNYRVEKMSLYAENEKYSNDKAVRLGSLGKTEIAKSC